MSWHKWVNDVVALGTYDLGAGFWVQPAVVTKLNQG